MPQHDARPLPSAASIACFGEALWDVLPRGIFLGGAPLNVAYHLSRQRVSARLISAVGRDFLGDEIMRRIAGWGIDARSVTRVSHRATGTVRAALDRKGAASYQIVRGVAWDRIAISRMLRKRPAPAALVFGTLALREVPNRKALARLFAAWPHALRVLDLNLRAPFDLPAVIRFALQQAQVVKLNDEELGRMTSRRPNTAAQIESAARQFGARHRLTRVCVTAGARGAGLLWDGNWFWEDARPVDVRDTIGAGDAFLAGLLAALTVRGESPEVSLEKASRMGEFVAGRDGATPPYLCDRHGRPHETVR